MDPATIAMLASLGLGAMKEEPTDIPMAGKSGGQSAAMLRKLKGDPNEGINALQSGLSLANSVSGISGAAPGVTAGVETAAPATGGPLEMPMSSAEAVARRTEKLGSEGPMAIEKGISALDNVDETTRKALAPALLQARYKARGSDIGGLA